METTNTIVELINLNKKIKEMYKRKEELLKEVFEKNGEDTKVFKGGSKGYVRVKIIDNVKALQEGGIQFKSVGFSPIDIEVKELKREPKEIKEGSIESIEPIIIE